MKKILILAGGTGSIALQNGIAEVIENKIVARENLDIKVLVNAYDNGLSTGAVRKVFNGAILGPSDVRKNHTTRLKIENPNSPWLKFLDIRFSISADKARSYCLSSIDSLRANLLAEANESLTASFNGETVDKIELLKEAVNFYFSATNSRKIDYDDFSIANIIYAGFAASNGYSLRTAASIMVALLGIKDNVILNDDTSLMLGAITKSGRFLTDEGDIVSWGSVDDPIVDTVFTDPVSGEARNPVLCDEAVKAIQEAELIIASSGTQWSSLIPTYESKGFREAIRNTKAKIVMVMNRVPDKDAPGASATDIVDLLVNQKKYFDEGQINLVVDSAGSAQMSTIQKDVAGDTLKSVTYFSGDNRNDGTVSSKHDPYSLAVAVMYAYHSEYLDSKHFIFDYDDTLVGRGNTFEVESRANLSIVAGLSSQFNAPEYARKISICSGNSIKAIKLPYERVSNFITAQTGQDVSEYNRGVTVFADGGINQYIVKTQEVVERDQDEESIKKIIPVGCINPDALLTISDKMSINDAINHRILIPQVKVENRGDAMIAIKPIDAEYRGGIVNFFETLKLIGVVPKNIRVQATGRSTIELKKSYLSKSICVNHLVKTLNCEPQQITYVGDEFYPGGNDYDVAAIGVKCLNVASPVDTALFLSSLSIKLRAERGSKFLPTGIDSIGTTFF